MTDWSENGVSVHVSGMNEPDVRKKGVMRPYIFLLPGLRGPSFLQDTIMRWIIRSWWNIPGEVCLINWFASPNSLEKELTRLREKVELISQDHNVILVGTSGGASIAINLFMTCADIEKIITVCGRVRKGDRQGFTSLDTRSRNHPIFQESVLQCEKRLETIRSDQLQRILNFQALFDEIVPTSTSAIVGARSKKVWCIEHGLNIFLALLFHKRTILAFIRP